MLLLETSKVEGKLYSIRNEFMPQLCIDPEDLPLHRGAAEKLIYSPVSRSERLYPLGTIATGMNIH